MIIQEQTEYLYLPHVWAENTVAIHKKAVGKRVRILGRRTLTRQNCEKKECEIATPCGDWLGYVPWSDLFKVPKSKQEKMEVLRRLVAIKRG